MRRLVATLDDTAPADARRWRSLAACRDADPELFFPVSANDPAFDVAVAYCDECIVKSRCLEYACSVGADGVWAGILRSRN